MGLASSILRRHWKLIKSLRENDDFIIIEADKNLGGCFLLRKTYCDRAIAEHLGNRQVYKPLSQQAMWGRQHCLRWQYDSWRYRWYNHGKGELSAAENTFLLRAYDEEGNRKPAKFRMSLKAHKTPWKMRPIVCCTGTLINYLSRWLDHQLQKLRPLIATYLKDSHDLLRQLKSLGPLPPNARLFTADANSMYTNIDTDHAISVIGLWLDNVDLPDGFPLGAVKEAMVLVMKNNIFEWGDMYFLQLLGTAMGTSAACMWATIYYAVHEMGLLIPKYNNNLLIFLWFIDDMFGIWLDDGNATTWPAFKRDVDDFGILTWEFEELSTSVDFLDLTISIEGSSLTTKTYQKSMNLYQYIPPQSAHPPGMIKGIIFGLMRNYYLQNSKQRDYHQMATKLFSRFVARGWDRASIKGHILFADNKLRHSPLTTATPEPIPTKNRLFIHLEYHPNHIPRKKVRELYQLHCEETFKAKLGVEQTTIAYSKHRNLQECLTKAKLHQPAGQEASMYYSGELP